MNFTLQLYKRIFNKKQKGDLEADRVRSLPRYEHGQSNLFGDLISFCDAATFLYGGREILQNEIYRFESLTQKPYIIDCGSNIGLSIIYFKKLYPESVILGYEPDPIIFDILNKNITQLGLQNVTIEKKAIWINDEGVKFNSEGGFSGRIAYKGDKKSIIKVPSQRLKNLLGVKVDLLKIDIEGAENEVFFDIESSLSNVENLFIEYHSYSDKPQVLHEILYGIEKQGFRYHITEAFSRQRPFTDRYTMVDMDLQLNIFAYRN